MTAAFSALTTAFLAGFLGCFGVTLANFDRACSIAATTVMLANRSFGPCLIFFLLVGFWD
jgi:hypothetical protein